MGSPRRSSPSELHRSRVGEMRPGVSEAMEPFVNATSPSKEKKTKKKSRSPSPKQDMASVALLSPKEETSSLTGVSDCSLPKSALHESLNNIDKTPSHSAASTRNRRPYFMKRLSGRVGSKQRRESKKRQKEIRQQDQEAEKQYRQYEITNEGRHPEEGTPAENTSSLGANVATSPSSTVQSAKSNNSDKKRRKKPSIKFLKRAISAPPALLQRLHSNPIDRDRTDSSWQGGNNQTRFPIPHEGSNSSSSRSSIDLNINNLIDRTKIVPKSYSPRSLKETIKLNRNDDETNEATAIQQSRCSATSILHHSYLPVLGDLCGVPQPEASLNKSQNSDSGINLRFPLSNDDQDDLRNRYYTSCLSEDPTVQESIECIFASQLEDGLNIWDEDGELYDNSNGPMGHSSFGSLEKVKTPSFEKDSLISPASLQQSRMNRKDRRDSSKSLFATMSQNKKRYEQASLVYVGTFDPSTPKNRVPSSTSYVNTSLDKSVDTVYSNLPDDPLPCACTTSFLPTVEPKDWPQAPLALRPTPGSGTKVKSIRFCNSDEPLWVPGSHMTWSQRLEEHWARESKGERRRKWDQQPHYACCESCVILPINNGNEAPGESLVVDFESELFEGTFMLRLRHAEGTTPEPYDDSRGYFKGMNRRYQACVRGRFKEVLPFTELMTGFKLDRKFGKLPSKWLLKSAMKVISFFAPQLHIKLEGVTKPYSMTPLGVTPQCINIDDNEDSSSNDDSDQINQSEHRAIDYSDTRMNCLDGVRIESTKPRRSILGISHERGAKTTSLQRAKIRRKAFEKLYIQKSKYPKTDPSKTYTFEFLQHMLNFQEFSIELGNMLGSIKLGEVLDGQPLQVMASHGDRCLWSFDVWNECLWEHAKEHDAIAQQQRHQDISFSPCHSAFLE